MNFYDSLNLFIAVAAVLIAAIGLLFANSQLRTAKKEFVFNTYVQFQWRYDDIINKLPDSIHDAETSLFDSNQNTEELMTAMRNLFDLLAEEWTLYRNGLFKEFGKKIWCDWTKGINDDMNCKTFHDGWSKVLRVEGDTYSQEFKSFMKGFDKKWNS